MSLIAWLPLNEDNIQEKLTNKPVSAGTGLTLPKYNNKTYGKIGAGYTFSNNGIKILNLTTTKQMSFALWVKLNKNASCHILDFRNASDKGYQPMYYGVSSGIQIFNNTEYGSAGAYVNDKTISDCKWHHLAVTIEENLGVLYVDGKRKGSISGITVSDSISTYATVGCRCSGTNPCSGIIQDVRIYDHILSDYEIKELSQALVLHYNFEDINISSNIFNAGTYLENAAKERCSATPYGTNGFVLTCTNSYTNKSGEKVTDPYLGTSANASSGSLNNNPTIDVGNATTICVSWTHVSGLEMDKNYITSLDANGKFLNSTHINFGGGTAVGNRRYAIITLPNKTKKIHLRFGNNDLDVNNSIIIDEICVRTGTVYEFTPPLDMQMPTNVSGLYSTTYCENLAIVDDAPQGKYAGKFSKSIIQCPFSTAGGEHFTVAAWVNPSSYAGDAILIGGLYLTINSEGKLSGYCYGKTNEGYHTGTTVIPKNKWTHIALVWDDKNIIGYINGKNEFTKSSYGAASENNHTKKDIGSENTTSSQRAFDGLIDDVRLYTTALSQQDIERIVNTKYLIDNKYNIYSANSVEKDMNYSSINSQSIYNFNQVSEMIELDDGSCWIQLSHHDNLNGTNLFSPTDDFLNKFVYHNDKCWSAFHLINTLGKYNNTNYEFMAIEQKNNTEQFFQYRWSQTVNPLTATHSQAWATANYKYNENYDQPSKRGGLFRYTSGTTSHGNTFLRIASGTSSNWYGAFGIFKKWEEHNGIPGFNAETNGILDLYVRVNPNKITYKEFNDGIIMPFAIKEI